MDRMTLYYAGLNRKIVSSLVKVAAPLIRGRGIGRDIRLGTRVVNPWLVREQRLNHIRQRFQAVEL
jgi:hypothetical protein